MTIFLSNEFTSFRVKKGGIAGRRSRGTYSLVNENERELCLI